MSRFRTLIKWSLISIVLVAVIWLGVIIWWQATQRVVTLQDTLVYLGVLPLALLICVGLLQWRSFRARHPKPSHTEDATDEAPAAAVESAPRLPILSAWAITSFAADAEAFLHSVRDRKVRPMPDASLTDEQGFPVLTTRIADLDTAALHDELFRIVAKRKVEHAGDPENRRETLLRTLALLARLLDQVLDDLPRHTHASAGTQAQPSGDAYTLRGHAASSSVSDHRLRLRVTLLIPAHFDPVEQQLAFAFLTQRIAALRVPGEYIYLDIRAAEDDATALALMDQFSNESRHDRHAQALLLLACDSALCDTIAEDWQANGRLFNSRCPNGLMMGEAAFAVLCANDKAVKAAAATPACSLTRVVRARRDAPADAPGKPSASCLSKVVQDALLAANLPGESIGTVSCDADHRSNRALECMGAMMEQTPHLDAIQNRLAAAEACGHIGSASVTAALVAAVMQSKDSEHPVLLFNVGHVIDRTAAVLIPSETATV
jgi:hypothetical protein